MLERARRILEVYPLEEILENNDLTEADVLVILIEQGAVTLPENEPL